MNRMMNKAEREAVKKLDSLGDEDKETIHVDADCILLDVVHPDVKDAYYRLMKRIGGFWYA